MITTARPSRRRVSAFARRAWIQQGRALVWIAVLAGAVLGALVFTESGGMRSLPTDLVPIEPGGLATIHDADGRFHPVRSFMLAMSPAMLGIMVAVVATLTLPGVVADDIRGGGIEALLAGPIPRRELFVAYLGAALALTAVAWGLVAVAFAAAVSVAAWVTGAAVSLTAGYVIAMVLVPLSLGVWSATATLFGALLYPRSLDSRTGLNGGPIRVLALSPAMVAVPSVLLLPDLLLPALGVVFAVSLLASLVIVRLTARGFRSTRVLGH